MKAQENAPLDASFTRVNRSARPWQAFEFRGGKFTGVEDSRKIHMIAVERIIHSASQARQSFNDASILSLANSIRNHGIINPITVRKSANSRDFFEIIAGERRLKAAKLLEMNEIPCIIAEADELEGAEISIIENIQREDLNPIEEAMAYKALSEEYQMTQEELSMKVGKSRSAIANTTRLLDLPAEVLTLVASGELSAGHGRTLLGLKNRDDMLALAEKVIVSDLSVRQLEEEVKRANKPQKPEPEEEEIPVVDYFREMEIRVQSHLGRKVKIEGKGRKKTLTLYYEDNEDLDELLEALCGKDFLNQV